MIRCTALLSHSQSYTDRNNRYVRQQSGNCMQHACMVVDVSGLDIMQIQDDRQTDPIYQLFCHLLQEFEDTEDCECAAYESLVTQQSDSQNHTENGNGNLTRAVRKTQNKASTNNMMDDFLMNVIIFLVLNYIIQIY